MSGTISTTDYEAILDDIGALLRVLGLGDHARPASPHNVFLDEILPAVQRLAPLLDPEWKPSEEGLAALPEKIRSYVAGLGAGAEGLRRSVYELEELAVQRGAQLAEAQAENGRLAAEVERLSRRMMSL